MRWLAIFISLMLLCCGCASVQPQLEGGDGVAVARVPDKAFRTYLLEQGYVRPYEGRMAAFGWFVPREEVVERTPMGQALQVLNVHNMGIRSLEGAELFGRLVVLVCSQNPLREVDLSPFPRLKQFVANEVPLQGLDLSRNSELKWVEVSFAELEELDVSHNAKLEEIYCIFTPGVKTLDLRGVPQLRRLYVRETSVREIDLTPCPSIEELHANDTPLATIVATAEQAERVKAWVEDSVRVELAESPVAADYSTSSSSHMRVLLEPLRRMVRWVRGWAWR